MGMVQPPAEPPVDRAAGSRRPVTGWFSSPGRTSVTVRGPDAVRFVDGFTTAAVASLATGESREGMVLDPRGHVLAIVRLLRTTDGVIIDGDPGIGIDLAAHLERYHIRERLEIVDDSAGRSACVAMGTDAIAWLARELMPGDAADEGAGGAGDALERQFDVAGIWPAARLFQVPSAAFGSVHERLTRAGPPRLEAAAVEAARIAHAYPAPHDIPAGTLPQELGRDARAISFTKGCYLGQETVARIDALGHVNRLLVLLTCGDHVPAPGAAVEGRHQGGGEEVVGRVTSACRTADGGGMALAIVARRALGEGGRLVIDGRVARPCANVDSGIDPAGRSCSDRGSSGATGDDGGRGAMR